jgi:uncharacterized protein
MNEGRLIARYAIDRIVGDSVEGEALVSEEGFSPRYDLDRWSGLITKPGHHLEGESIVNRICFFPTAKGGIAAGWAFPDIVHKGLAPKGLIFGVTNPVMVQGAAFAGITLTEGLLPDAFKTIRSGDWVKVCATEKTLFIYRHD